MKLYTTVNIQPADLLLSHDRPIMMLGSCFTDEIGLRLIQSGFEVMCNPFGTLYNPLSIAACLNRIMQAIPIGEDCLVFQDGLYHSWFHHGSYSSPNKNQVLTRCNASLEDAVRFLERDPLLLVTLGTAFAFFLNNPSSSLNGQVVSNCHKVHPQQFIRRRISVDEVVQALLPFLGKYQMIMTVSPIRHLADGLHGNQLSKATLLMAVEQLTQHGCDYFPSYEILLDELRDYRYYSRDLCHPSDVAVDIIYERFQQSYMSEQTRLLCIDYQKQYRHSQHRQIHNI